MIVFCLFSTVSICVSRAQVVLKTFSNLKVSYKKKKRKQDCHKRIENIPHVINVI